MFIIVIDLVLLKPMHDCADKCSLKPGFHKNISIRTTIIFKTTYTGTDSPQAYNLRKIYSPAPPFQCCVPIFILFQATTVSAYSSTTLIGEGAGKGRNCERETGLSS